MTREIKFRAFDHNDRVMLYQLAEIIFSNYYGDEAYDIMQYTGLKDKNGKEIYEGDILKISDELYEEVKWITPEIWMNDKCPVNGFINHESIYQTKPEIIGNIYEKPELKV